MSGLNISFLVEAIDGFSKTFDQLEQKTKGISDHAKAAGTAITGAGILGAAALGGTVKVAADFESAMSRVAALSGATDDELQKLTGTAKDLGAKTSFSASQAAEGMSYLAMA